MIVFINKGFSLFPYLESKGVFLEQLDNEWISNSPDELVNKLIDEFNPWPEEKAKKLAEFNEWLESKSYELVSNSPDIEQKSWPTQVNEAFGLMPLNVLPSIASERGMTVEELIQRVKKNHGDYYSAYGLLQGRRDYMKSQLAKFPDVGDYHLLPELWALSCTG